MGVKSDDTGINKPFDRILKAFADEAPGIFLRILGIVPSDAAPKLTPLRAETAPAVVMPDFVSELTFDDGERVTFHVEFYVNYFRGIPSLMARYGGSLAWQYLRRVLSLVVLLKPDGMPKKIPRTGSFDIGETRTQHPFQVVRMWELDAAPILESDDVRVLPWSIAIERDRCGGAPGGAGSGATER